MDLDGDGDRDLVLGEIDGSVLAWRNTGTAAAPVFTALTGAANPFNGIDVGNDSKPAFLDLDGDGDLDFVAGASSGAFQAWRNTGTASAPVFTQLTGTENPFGSVGGGAGSTPAFVDLDGDGDLDLVSGDVSGNLLAWRNTAPLPTITITVTAQNDAPIVTSAGSASFAENGVGVAYRAAGADPEGATLRWFLYGLDAAFFDMDPASGAVTFITAPDFEAPADNGGNNVYDITVTASDGTLGSGGRVVSITVTNLATPPALAGFAPAITFAENSLNLTPRLLDSDVTFTSESSLSGGRLVVAGLLAEDRVSILGNATNQIVFASGAVSQGATAFGTVSGGVGASFTVTFNANATAARVEALIESLAYQNVSDTPTATRNLTLNVVDGAGKGLGVGVGTLALLSGTANPFNGITVPVFSRPAFLDLDGDGDLDLVSGADDGTLLSWRNAGTATAPMFAALTGSANAFAGIDAGLASNPAFVDLDGDGDLDLVVGNYAGQLQVWRNGGPATAPVFTELTGSNNPFLNIDAGARSQPAFVDLDGDGRRDLVVGEASGTLLAWRNSGTNAAPSFVALSGTANPFSGNDVGDRSTPAFVDLDGDGDLDLVSGEEFGALLVWRNTGTAAAPVFTALSGANNPFNALNVGLASAPAFMDLDGDGDLDLVAGNGPGTFVAVRNTSILPGITVTVTAQNDAPGVTSAATASFAENGTGVAYQAAGSDPEGTTLSWSLGGTDAGRFNINAASGAVSFKTAPDFEVPADAGGNNVYDITVTASDGALSSAARAVAITVTHLNEASGVTSGGTADFTENVIGVAYQATGSDPDAGTILTWTLGGTDAGRFDINAASGAVSFKTAPDFEAPADSGGNNIYDITVTASDGALSSAARAVAITVANAVPGNRLDGFSASITFVENAVNAAPRLLATDVVFTQRDGRSGGRLVVSGLLAEDRISILGNATNQIVFANGTVSQGATAFGTISGGVGTGFTVTFNADATAARVEALIESLAYQNVSDTPTAFRKLTLDVTDGAGQGLPGLGIGSLTMLIGPDNPFWHVDGMVGGGDIAPAFVDLDGDGDLDLVSGAYHGTIMAWRNTRTAAAPVFTALDGTANPFNGIDAGYASAPAFMDLDGDGDLDLVSGRDNGTILVWDHSSSAYPFNAVDVQFDSTPAFVDLDGDGDLDLVSGAGDGTIQAWRNTGTAAAPVFTPMTGTANPFDGLDAGYNSAPAFVDLDGDGDLDLVSGALDGTLAAWRNTGTAAAPAFMALTGTANPFSGIDVGFFSTPAFVDLDGDGDLDLVSGETDGRLLAWRNTSILTSITVTAEQDAPSITSAATANFAENGNGVAYQATGSDPEGTTLTWTLGGTDAGLFDISATGAVTFKTAPNFEAPTDVGGDNVYDITVTASDGTLSSAARAVAITATDVLEPVNRVGGTGADLLTGTAFNDTLSGSAGNDTLIGGDGNDRLNGGTGADSMVGGMGNDSYAIDNVGDTVVELAGEGTADALTTIFSTTLSGALAEIESLTLAGLNNLSGTGNAYANSITGNAGDNTLVGGDGNDRLHGGLGADSMVGGTGNDSYTIDNAGDVVLELAGEGTADALSTIFSTTLSGALAEIENLTLSGSAALSATGNAYANSITGNIGDNTLVGGEGNDKLNGGLGADSLEGGTGNDTLDGGLGQDTLTGGAGNDSFSFATLTGSALATPDLITDFTPGADRVSVSAIDTDAVLAGNQAFAWIGGAAFAGAGVAQARFFNNGVNTFAAFDMGDGGDAELLIQFNGVLALSASNFVL